MAAKVPSTVPSPDAPKNAFPGAGAAGSNADCLTQIQALGRKVGEHVRLVAKIETWPGISAEARGKAVVAFHDRLASLERALEKILDDLRLE